MFKTNFQEYLGNQKFEIVLNVLEINQITLFTNSQTTQCHFIGLFFVATDQDWASLSGAPNGASIYIFYPKYQTSLPMGNFPKFFAHLSVPKEKKKVLKLTPDENHHHLSLSNRGEIMTNYECTKTPMISKLFLDVNSDN